MFPSVLSTGFVCAHAMDVCALGALGMFYAVCIHDLGVLGCCVCCVHALCVVYCMLFVLCFLCVHGWGVFRYNVPFFLGQE